MLALVQQLAKQNEELVSAVKGTAQQLQEQKVGSWYALHLLFTHAQARAWVAQVVVPLVTASERPTRFAAADVGSPTMRGRRS